MDGTPALMAIGTYARPERADVDLRKPSRIGGRIDRAEKHAKRKAAKVKAKKAADDELRKADRARRFRVYLRDHRRCRAFGTPLLFDTDNVLKLAQNHHITFRSAGGSDDDANTCTLGPIAHRMVHEGELEISGNANETLTLRQFEFKGGTRKFIRTWESSIQ